LRNRIRSTTRRAEQSLERAKADELAAAKAMLDAYRDGMPWDQVAEAAGLETGNQARLRAMRAKDEDELPPSRRRRTADPADDAQVLGVSVEEAAKRLGVTRPTVYRRIDRGELQAVSDAQGRTRVLLDD
jgi:excisionase family DNA binding protein